MDATDPATLPDPYPITTLERAPDAEIRVPGGRSATNRALVAAALADGQSRLVGPGRSDDTEAMAAGLRALGVGVAAMETVDDGHPVGGEGGGDVIVEGVAGRPVGPASIFTRLSGTTSRFITPVAALASEPVRIDAAPPMRARPMGDLIDALRRLGVDVDEEGERGHLPLTVTGPLLGREVEVPGEVSSQFLSGLLLAGGARREGLTVRCSSDRLVSAPYVAMTRRVMADFGVDSDDDGGGTFTVARGGYRGATYAISPDAATAGYFLAAAAVTGGRVRIPGLPSAASQADAALVDVLAALGATVTRHAGGTEVVGPPRQADGRVHLGGGTFDLTAFSDMAPTVAAVAAVATAPVRVTGVGFIRGKETDRLAASVAELRRCGVDAEEEADGFVVRPGGPGPHGAVVRTYDDHRMAMSFAVLGLVVPGIAIADPGCVAKTHPAFFADLDRLRRVGG